MIMINSADLLRVDLEGVHIILPHLVTALEAVLPEREARMQQGNAILKADLRRSAIHLLVSMVALPLHFQVS